MSHAGSAQSEFAPGSTRLVIQDSGTDIASARVGGPLLGARVIHQRLRRWWKEQTAPRVEDETLDSAGVSVTRFVAPALAPLLIVPVILLLREPGNFLAGVALGFGAIAIVCSVIADRIERRIGTTFWLHLANAALYSVLITAVLWASVMVEHPREHIHWVLFFLYFLLIGASGMSDDPRQPLCAGGLSIIGYVSLLPLIRDAAAAGVPMAARLLPEFEWVANATKVAVMIGATLLAMSSAARGRAVRRLSLRDGLTGLLNRHAFDRCLDHLAGVSARKGHPLTIAMIDIDHFKRLNDDFGHMTGDDVLRWVGGRLRQSFRATDVVARYGGEEFVVAFPETGDARIADRLESFREEIATTSLLARREAEPSSGEGASEREIRVTLSIGTAIVPTGGGDVAAALALADERLYEAKQAGRNRIVGHA